MWRPQPRTSLLQPDACNYFRQFLDDAIASLTSAVWSVCIGCVCCHSVRGWNCVFVPSCVFGHNQLLCSRQHRVTSGLSGLSRELEEKTSPSGESQPQQIQAVLAVSFDIWPDPAPTTLAHKVAPRRPRFEIFLLRRVQKTACDFIKSLMAYCSVEESALEIATTQAKGQSRIFYLLITLSGPVHRSGVSPLSSSPARKPRGFSRTTWRL